MTLQTILPVQAAQIKEWAEARGEAAWVTEHRLQALEAAPSLELPKPEKTKLDRWNLSAYGTFKAAEAVGQGTLPAAAKDLIDEGAHNLIVQLNSGVVHTVLSEELSAQGVIFTDLETATREHEDLVKKHFGSAVKPGEHQVSALHYAAWNGGVFLYVPKNVELEAPLQAVFLSDDASASFAPHILIVADTNSRVTYVDSYVSAGLAGEVLHNGVVEVIALDGAKVQYATVHQFGKEVTDISFRRALLSNDSSIEWIVGEMNDGDTATDTATVLNGSGTNSDAKIIAIGSGSQKLNYTTRAVHFGKSSESDMFTRAVMREEAQAIINGITKIEHGATKANGQQAEKVLMLSPAARGDANPILLIDEDDVMAGHAASVGKVNPEQIYYLMSRGISKPEAERLIIYGFLAPIIAEIPLELLRTRLQRVVERKLGQ
ncbi:Fe-S cluster assembly protein SufD [Saccharibacillus sp. CPCC 101409]|uniref:Fe-S cluster assembly protein SufD n=1 Tax=Saccharibacillus sp. CPCC 101409 TaxID=3058041 RepID=UPI0026730D3A|nr:Fe-S cluster assembly protein SufD [Saccharibacillus sp. CPCC 101409]MDO3408828.1 Fe-S cluster assembly protein SufD [Saccharibacillus sp. CPCC 101409]